MKRSSSLVLLIFLSLFLGACVNLQPINVEERVSNLDSVWIEKIGSKPFAEINVSLISDSVFSELDSIIKEERSSVSSNFSEQTDLYKKYLDAQLAYNELLKELSLLNKLESSSSINFDTLCLKEDSLEKISSQAKKLTSLQNYLNENISYLRSSDSSGLFNVLVENVSFKEINEKSLVYAQLNSFSIHYCNSVSMLEVKLNELQVFLENNDVCFNINELNELIDSVDSMLLDLELAIFKLNSLNSVYSVAVDSKNLSDLRQSLNEKKQLIAVSCKI